MPIRDWRIEGLLVDDVSKSAIDVEDTVDWLVDGVRSVKVSEDILRELVERLLAAGLPLYRVAVFVPD